MQHSEEVGREFRGILIRYVAIFVLTFLARHTRTVGDDLHALFYRPWLLGLVVRAKRHVVAHSFRRLATVAIRSDYFAGLGGLRSGYTVTETSTDAHVVVYGRRFVACRCDYLLYGSRLAPGVTFRI